METPLVADLIAELPLFRSWLAVEQDRRPTTVKNHYFRVKQILKGCNCDAYNRECVIGFLSSKMDCDPLTRANFIASVRAFNVYLVEKGLLNENWAYTIKPPKRVKKIPKVLSTSEIERLLGASLNYSHYPDAPSAKYIYDTIFHLLAKTGARVGEVLKIKVGDIDYETGKWSIEDSKTRTGRIIPICPDTLTRVKKIAQGKSAESFLFINPYTERPMEYHSVLSNFQNRIKETGIKRKATIHTLRHSFITELLRQNISVMKIANICGHEDIKTTMDYGKLLFEDLSEAILHHPLVASQRNPYEIIEHVKKTLEQFRLKEDTRFMYSLDDSNDGLRLSIFIR